MKHQMAIVKNVVNLREAYEAVRGRDTGIPGMVLVHGETGYGKSTTLAWLSNQVSGVYVRATAAWTPSAMLGEIMIELGASPMHNGGAAMVKHIAAKLIGTQRPLIVDEADYPLGNPRMIETLRDIHDLSHAPVILIGMKGIDRKIAHRPQLARRISEWVEFLPADIEDTHVLVKSVCEVELEDDLIEHLHNEAAANIGRMIVGLSRIERFAKTNDLDRIGVANWGGRQLFLASRSTARGI